MALQGSFVNGYVTLVLIDELVWALNASDELTYCRVVEPVKVFQVVSISG